MNKRLWLPRHGPRQEQCWLVLRSNRQPEMNALEAAAQNTEISICDLASCMCCYKIPMSSYKIIMQRPASAYHAWLKVVVVVVYLKADEVREVMLLYNVPNGAHALLQRNILFKPVG